MSRETDRSITVRDDHGWSMNVSTEHRSVDVFNGIFSHKIERQRFIRIEGMIHESEILRVFAAAKELLR